MEHKAQVTAGEKLSNARELHQFTSEIVQDIEAVELMRGQPLALDYNKPATIAHAFGSIQEALLDYVNQPHAREMLENAQGQSLAMTVTLELGQPRFELSRNASPRSMRVEGFDSAESVESAAKAIHDHHNHRDNLFMPELGVVSDDNFRTIAIEKSVPLNELKGFESLGSDARATAHGHNVVFSSSDPHFNPFEAMASQAAARASLEPTSMEHAVSNAEGMRLNQWLVKHHTKLSHQSFERLFQIDLASACKICNDNSRVVFDFEKEMAMLESFHTRRGPEIQRSAAPALSR